MDAFLELLGRGARPERFVVSADSLPVLDPKPGDVVEEAGGGKVRVRRLAARDVPLAGMSYRVLQRAGKPFFTPDHAEG